MNNMVKMVLDSPIELKKIEDYEIFIKRDDLLNRDFSGNKARKFYYFLVNNFPNIKKIVGYGSNQSNAMYSLSVLAKIKGWEFEYYTNHISKYLKMHPHGNYKYALLNGMKIITTPNMPKREEIEDDVTLFVEEGGRQNEAYFGIAILAKEIDRYQQEHGMEYMSIFLPSGTGATALFLQKALKELNNLSTVYTVPCVGDSRYLRLQFSMLERDSRFYPIIIEPHKRFYFGKLYKESYDIWLKLRDLLGIEFDLLYDPIGWMTLLNNIDRLKEPILYIHQGGIIGNESMLRRYKRIFNEDIRCK